MSLEAIAYGMHQEITPSDLRVWGTDTRQKAMVCLKSITDFDFIAVFCTTYCLLSPLQGITQKLQSRSNDICKAYQLVSRFTSGKQQENSILQL